MKYQTKLSALFNSIVSTMSGVQVKDIRFNEVLKVWFGTVSGAPHAWDSEGRCIDRTKPELDFCHA